MEQFENILDFLTDTCTVLPLSDGIRRLKNRSLPSRAVALTFDDGYCEWLDNVSPALHKRNLHGTFFVTTQQLTGTSLWHERIIAAVKALPRDELILPYGFDSFKALHTVQHRIQLVSLLHERLKYASISERITAIELLEKQAAGPLELPKKFTKEMVRQLASKGFEIGAHTIQHPILNECSQEEARNEIGGSKEVLEEITRGKISLFAYPNGRPLRDYNANHIRIVKDCGYTAAVTTGSGAACVGTDLFELPRISPWASGHRQIAYQITRNLASEVKKSLPFPIFTKKKPSTDVRCLLIASTFAPIHGGSAVVYQNICKHMPTGSIRVLSARRNYLNEQAISGWHEHDTKASYPIDRIDLLRPPMAPPPANVFVSLYRLVLKDIPLYAKVLFAACKIVHHSGINVICIGELVTGGWLAIALKKIFGCKVVIYVHGEEITTATPGRLHGNRRRTYLSAADKVIAVSSFTCDSLTRLMKLPVSSLCLIQNGVDTDRFSPADKDFDIIKRFGLAEKKIILTVGRLVPRKGIDMAVRAIKHVKESHPDIHYLIVGQGQSESELKKIIEEEGVANYVTLVGNVSDAALVKYFQTCDIFVMPNRTMPDGDTEGFGLVFREANACKKPVIGGRAGGAVEAVIDGETGLLVDGNSPKDIAEALARLLSDSDLRESMAQKGLQLALAHDTKSVAEKFYKTCQRMLHS
ncbi:Glycosyltransferase involved in cell wall bisynthesis [Noviherbaspirillum humi]|uniref:Glycosyltransferase involved in cell wall bisynthesis n=1 Tax=Noviherbaspirillum humi TaxID=1688639 RepID=A0A239HKI4_9BURK|nr:glycosyltransferase [Noviherbaspirillum humi]SNS81665.1 Glycosyltransferase involved in cell wall bisynthesis [Noviherbaspirillum humi]